MSDMERVLEQMALRNECPVCHAKPSVPCDMVKFPSRFGVFAYHMMRGDAPGQVPQQRVVERPIPLWLVYGAGMATGGLLYSLLVGC